MSERDGDRARSPSESRGALTVAVGILCSRTAGLVRAAVTSAAFGVGPHADVLQTALRAPNVLQNLLGEQVLSASFIPVYSRLLASGDRAAARRFANAAFGLLLVTTLGLVVLGVLAAEPLVALFASGFLRDAGGVARGELSVDRFQLTVRAVRWIFPMTGLLVLSAWALGVLNSHRKFLLPYVAPVFWNAAIVTALVWVGQSATTGASPAPDRLLFAACFGALVGGLLQLLVQLPGAIRAIGGLRPEISLSAPGVRPALTALGPAIAGRGVVQLSSYLDLILASFLAPGAPSALGYAQMLYLLPISLFGQATAAAALPELSRSAQVEGADSLATRTRATLTRTDFFVAPTAVAFLLLGSVAIAGLYRLFAGRFTTSDTLLVTLILAAYALGLPASTSSRLLQTTFFSLGDTRSPARAAAGRVVLSAILAVPLMLALDRVRIADLFSVGASDSAVFLGGVGLALAASVGAWYERLRLGRSLAERLPGHATGRADLARKIAISLAAALPAAVAAFALAALHPTVRAALVFALYGASYLLLCLAFGLPEARAIVPRRHRRS